ncbi:hypothetical protein O6H91_03G013700 [Diphasiastrum complanatum]|uniref:Uncharacterized protein n=2 Tax=Diphasiastrum complanatum TaxID=34168 RepID=A0ACC2E3M3_DIPCM|nr:hypothetical protein O6H91_03G013700 [Diphasiastrum complanatum]KAJ7561093.1 hypothetical protein O6H91_03G013700 [Diphasiastrum complanatum]
MKVVGVFLKGCKYATKNPRFLLNVEAGLGLKPWLEAQGHHYHLTHDKDGPNSELERLLPDTDILITTPFHPGYVTADRIQKAKNLKLLVTAGVGSDHIDLHAAAAAGITVAEITGVNVVSVAEDELMRVLILLRNFVPGWKQITAGNWDVAEVIHRSYDLEGKTVGTVGAGRIGQLLLQRLKPFNCNLLYYDRNSIGEQLEKELGAIREPDLDTLLSKCDVVVLNVPLTDKTRGFFDKERLSKMKKGAYIVNNARGGLMDVDAVVEACNSGYLGGYSGDVWYPQPPPKDHPWRYMENHAMTPHISGASLDAQWRIAAGTKDTLEKFFKGQSFPKEYYIVKPDGQIAPQYT